METSREKHNDQSSKDKQQDKIKIEFSRSLISYISASIVFVIFFIFVTGYYWGKRAVTEQFSEELDDKILNDQVQKAFYLDLQNLEEPTEGNETLDQKNLEIDSIKSEDVDQKNTDNSVQSTTINNSSSVDDTSSNSKDDIKESQEEYAAHLIGFGTLKAAKLCVDSYKKQGFDVSVSEREGKTSKGKIRKWYQVVTKWYNNKKNLEKILPDLKKIGRLKDITLVVRDKN